jgi:hypothetical protein
MFFIHTSNNLHRRNILDVLHCLDDFSFFKPDDRPSFVVFSVLREILSSFPHLMDSVYEFILRTILETPKFLQNVVKLVRF